MTRPVIAFVSLIICAAITLAAPQGPEIRMVEDKMTVQANSVSLGRLIEQFDFATGMNSRVPPELANRPVSVQFTDLPLNAAVEKIFQGQMLDYIYVGGRGIVVTAVSQATPVATGPAATPFPR